MIKYALRCDQGHEFQAWFASIKAFETLAKTGQLDCAECGSRAVERAIMAPAVARSDLARSNRGRLPALVSASAPSELASEPTKEPTRETSLEVRSGDDATWSNRRVALAMLRKLRDEVLARSEYVGPRFADEAREIHEQTTAEGWPGRPIHGEATPDEVRSLLEDGIPVAPIPRLPEDGN